MHTARVFYTHDHAAHSNRGTCSSSPWTPVIPGFLRYSIARLSQLWYFVPTKELVRLNCPIYVRRIFGMFP